MLNSDYNLKRDIVDEIFSYIKTDNIIVLHGSRQVGKTYILRYIEKILQNQKEQTFFFDLEDAEMAAIIDHGVNSFLNFLQAEKIDLKKKAFVFIDEIQNLENPSPFLKLVADHEKQIQLVVSGSSNFEIKKKFSDSLAGRTVDFEIYALNFSEFLRFKNEKINLNNLNDEFHINKTINLYQEFMQFGGYPKIVKEKNIQKKEKYLKQIVDTYVKRDIRDLAEIRNPKKFNEMLKILASQSGGLLNISELSETCGLARETVENYLFLLESTYIIKLLPPFSQSAKVEIVKSPKIFFFDTGLLQILWLKTFAATSIGNIFETSVFSELTKKYGKDKIYFWRTKNQTEIDFVLEQRQGITGIEAKTSFRKARGQAVMSFMTKYKNSKFKIAGLLGEKRKPDYFFPWEI